jgi:hypothetical protein
MIVKTVFLLKNISDIKLREQIGASTNKVEAPDGYFLVLMASFQKMIRKNKKSELNIMI